MTPTVPTMSHAHGYVIQLRRIERHATLMGGQQFVVRVVHAGTDPEEGEWRQEASWFIDQATGPGGPITFGALGRQADAVHVATTARDRWCLVDDQGALTRAGVIRFILGADDHEITPAPLVD